MAVRLTERDLDIMLALARNGFMAIDQIQNKWFPSYSACINRLIKLKQAQYIKAHYIERNGKGIYSITKDGLVFINDYYGCNYKAYARSNRINHFILCSELYLNFPYKIIDYELEYYLDDLIPDIYVKYYNGREVDLLIEIDNTSRKSIIRNKIYNYNKYLTSNKWQSIFTKFPKCMIVTNVKSKGLKVDSLIPFIIISYQNLKELRRVL